MKKITINITEENVEIYYSSGLVDIFPLNKKLKKYKNEYKLVAAIMELIRGNPATVDVSTNGMKPRLIHHLLVYTFSSIGAKVTMIV